MEYRCSGVHILGIIYNTVVSQIAGQKDVDLKGADAAVFFPDPDDVVAWGQLYKQQAIRSATSVGIVKDNAIRLKGRLARIVVLDDRTGWVERAIGSPHLETKKRRGPALRNRQRKIDRRARSVDAAFYWTVRQDAGNGQQVTVLQAFYARCKRPKQRMRPAIS